MFHLNLFRSAPHNNALQDALRLAASRQRQGYLLELLQTHGLISGGELARHRGAGACGGAKLCGASRGVLLCRRQRNPGWDRALAWPAPHRYNLLR
mgnify:CR=1 FL=1